MNKRTTRWAIGGLVAMTLLAAACGSDDKSSDTAAPTTAASATTAGSATTAASATTAGGATTTAGSATTAKPATTAAGSAAGTTPAKAKGTLQGSGSTLQLAYQQEAIDAFQKANSGATITYGGGGSGKGRTDLKNKTVDFAGSDSAFADADKPAEEILYFPILLAPITVSYNLSGVDKLQLSADTIAKIFQRADHEVGRRGHRRRQPGRQAAVDGHRRRPPHRRLGHDAELHGVAGQGGADDVDAEARFDGRVAGRHAGRQRQRRRGPDRPGHRRGDRLRRPLRRGGRRA